MALDPAKEAILLLQQSVGELIPNEKAFLIIRDFLIVRLALENCQRPGPLENATLVDFRRIKEVDGVKVMKVALHKTTQEGPANITISDNLLTNLQAYVKHARPHFAEENEEALFITRDGVRFPHGTIGKRVIQWWRKATGTHLSSTALRKMGSSETAELETSEQAAVQAVMGHKHATAVKYYQILKKTKQAVQGAKVLQRQLGLGQSVPTSLDVNETIKTDEAPEEVFESPSKTGLDENMLEDIDLLFADKINTNAPLTLLETKNMMSESINLISCIDDPSMVKRVYNRVKYLQRRDFETNLNALPSKDDDKESLVTFTSSSSKRKSWCRDDELLLENAFKSYQKCPDKKTIEALLDSSVPLRELRDRNSFMRSYEKVKSIFQKLAK